MFERTISAPPIFGALTLLLLGSAAQATTYSLGRAAFVEGPAAGNDSVVLGVTPDAGAWTASANASWLHLASGSAKGTGSANVCFSFDANTGSTRSGALIIAGQTVTITQAGAAYVAAGGVTPIVAQKLNEPSGVAVDRAGNVYVADRDNNSIKEYIAATQTLTTLVSSGLSYPDGVALDGAGNVYIADSNNSAIKEYVAATQSVVTLVSSGLVNPTGIAVDGVGNVYIADNGNSAIREYVAATQTVTTLVSSGLSYPAGVAVDGAGNVYFTEPYTGAIKEYNAATQVLTALVPAGPLPGLGEVPNGPSSIAVDGAGNLFYSYSNSGGIKEYIAATKTVSTLVSSGIGPGGVALDGSGNIYIGDGANNAIEEYAPANKTVTTLASSGRIYPDGAVADGVGNVYFADELNNTIEKYTAATQTMTTLVSSGLSFPRAVALDGAGNVYIADWGNNAIKEYVAATRTLITLVSTGLHLPNGVAVDGSGNVYIADFDNNAIKEYLAATQTVTTLVSSGLKGPYGVAVDAAGDVYFADSGNNAIKEYMAATRTVTALVSSGLNSPRGAAVDGAGNVYFIDYVIQVENYGGGPESYQTEVVKEFVAATQTVIALVSTGLGNPTGVAVDASGNVYIADPVDNRISELPRAFVDPTTKFEPGTAGSDVLPVVLPSTTSLLAPFAPKCNPSWLTVPSVSGGVVGFSFTADSSPGRVGSLTVLGQPIIVVQGSPPPPPIAGSVTAFVANASPITINVLASDSSPLNYPLTVASVTPPSLGQAEINPDYSITYTPYASFAAFTGSDSFTYTISDGHGGSATAGVTIRNPFQTINGAYDGLVEATGGAGPNGYLTLSLTGAGSFTGGLSYIGRRYSFNGVFGSDGTAVVSIKRAGAALITLTLSLDEATGSNLSVSISVDGYTDTLNTGAREIYSLANPAPSAGSYTALLPASASSGGIHRIGASGEPPQGTGWAAMAVGQTGAVKVAGKLGDGTPFSFGGFVNHAGQDSFAFYKILYSGMSKPDAPGSIGGTIVFEPLTGSDCDGALVWVRPAQTSGASYHDGFSANVSFTGGRYTPPVAAQVLDFTDKTAGAATFQLSLGILSSPLINKVSVSDHNVVTVTPPNTDSLMLNIHPAAGTFTGTASAANRTSAISGVIYQKSNLGAGLFLGASETGNVALTPQ